LLSHLRVPSAQFKETKSPGSNPGTPTKNGLHLQAVCIPGAEPPYSAITITTRTWVPSSSGMTFAWPEASVAASVDVVKS